MEDELPEPYGECGICHKLVDYMELKPCNGVSACESCRNDTTEAEAIHHYEGES